MIINWNNYYIFSEALSTEICDKIISLGSDFIEGTVSVNKGIGREQAVDNNIRNNKLQPTSEQWLYDLFWPYMVKANEKAGWNYKIETAEEFHICQYDKGEFYDWHIDGRADTLSVYTEEEVGNNNFLLGRVRKLTLIALLNDDYRGGELELIHYEKENFEIINPDIGKGSILIFPSSQEHRVTPVLGGCRYSLIGLFLGPPLT